MLSFLFSTSGTIGRKQFFLYDLALVVIALLLSVIDYNIGTSFDETEPLGFISYSFLLLSIISSVALYIKRARAVGFGLRDTWLSLIPIYGLSRVFKIAFGKTVEADEQAAGKKDEPHLLPLLLSVLLCSLGVALVFFLSFTYARHKNLFQYSTPPLYYTLINSIFHGFVIALSQLILVRKVIARKWVWVIAVSTVIPLVALMPLPIPTWGSLSLSLGLIGTVQWFLLKSQYRETFHLIWIQILGMLSANGVYAADVVDGHFMPYLVYALISGFGIIYLTRDSAKPE